jgi:ATP-dependent RNA helicase RhlE
LSFNHLKLIEPLLKALHQEGYTTPTPIQLQAIPAVLDRRDLRACAQTGTGKTAAFALPLLQLMQEDKKAAPHPTKAIRTLVLAPTRELAIQINDSFKAYGRFLHIRHTVVFGGVSQVNQVKQLRQGVDVLIATPGRLLDLMQQGHVSLKEIRYFVLDEADRMLDMGFVHDVKKIISRLPAKRQTLFFSATMPAEINALAGSILFQPVKVEVTPVSSTADRVRQEIYFTEKAYKSFLLKHLLEDHGIETALVFTRTKHGADKLAKFLNKSGIRADAIHGNKSQAARQTALRNFKERSTRILVATDIAARGIDIDNLTHVFNYELPEVPETYVHRIGRTGRAGADGTAISFCDHEEKPQLNDIQKLILKTIPVMEEHPYPSTVKLSNINPPKALPHHFNKRSGGRSAKGRGQLHRPMAAR